MTDTSVTAPLCEKLLLCAEDVAFFLGGFFGVCCLGTSVDCGELLAVRCAFRWFSVWVAFCKYVLDMKDLTK